MTEPTTAAGQKCPLCGHEPVTVTPQKYGFPKVEARQQDASALREALDELPDRLRAYDDAWNLMPSQAKLEDTIRSQSALGAWVIKHRAVLAALPPSAPAGLDVERLERALFGVRFNPLRDSSMEWAERIAAEYARLEQDPP